VHSSRARASRLAKSARRALTFVSVSIGVIACAPGAAGSTAVTCDDVPKPATQLPAELVDAGVLRAVGAGDTWFEPPARGPWSGSMQRDAQGYWMKVGIYTLAATPPGVAIKEAGGAGRTGSSKSNPTAAGLPGPLPTTLRFPGVGCWEVTAQGISANATILVKVIELPLN
jgi:hypothetical protein